MITFFHARTKLLVALVVLLYLLLPLIGLAQENPAANTNPVQAYTFEPLTQLPGLDSISESESLAGFLNQLYKILIGVGAVGAVIMIMFAGVQIMISSGSVRTNTEAKSRISNAVLGLLLILSPVIVFGIINPDILKLELDVRGLQSQYENVEVGAPGQFKSADQTLWQSMNGDRKADTQLCAESSGTPQYGCKKKDGSSERYHGVNDQCGQDENSFTLCRPPADSPKTAQQCTDQYSEIRNVPMTGNNKCSTLNGFVAVPNGCCAGANGSGNLCCAKPKNNSADDIAKLQIPEQYAWAIYFRPKNGSAAAAVTLVKSGPFATADECRRDYASKEFSLSLSNQERTDFPLGPQCLCDKQIKDYPNCPYK